jgi:hypothetical protein
VSGGLPVNTPRLFQSIGERGDTLPGKTCPLPTGLGIIIVNGQHPFSAMSPSNTRAAYLWRLRMFIRPAGSMSPHRMFRLFGGVSL